MSKQSNQQATTPVTEQLSRTQAALSHALQAFKSRSFTCTHGQLISECESVLAGEARVIRTGVDRGNGKVTAIVYEHELSKPQGVGSGNAYRKSK